MRKIPDHLSNSPKPFEEITLIPSESTTDNLVEEKNEDEEQEQDEYEELEQTDEEQEIEVMEELEMEVLEEQNENFNHDTDELCETIQSYVPEIKMEIFEVEIKDEIESPEIENIFIDIPIVKADEEVEQKSKKNNDDVLKNPEVKCLDCKKTMSIIELMAHRELEHPEPENQEYEDIMQLKKRPVSSVPKPKLRKEEATPEMLEKIQCDKCCRKIQRYRMEMHQELFHLGARPFLCHICSASFALDKNLKHHLLTHDLIGKFVCDICVKR